MAHQASVVREIATGKVIKFPTPWLRPILPTLPTKSVDQIPGTDFVSSSYHGLRQTVDPNSASETSLTPDVLMHAYVAFLRYNELPEHALQYGSLDSPRLHHAEFTRAMLNVIGSSDKQPYTTMRQSLKKRAQNWQKSMVSCQTSTTDDGAFWYKFIAHEVTTHNVETHISNLRTESAKIVGTSFNAIFQRAELAAAADEQQYQWTQSVERHYREQKSLLETMSSVNRNSSYGQTLKLFVDQLARDMVRIQKYGRTPGQALAGNIRQSSLLYYHDMDADTQASFWRRRLTLQVACHVWRHMKDKIPIEKNLYASPIGDMMHNTFVFTAMKTWQVIVEPDVDRKAMIDLGGKAVSKSLNLILETTLNATVLQQEVYMHFRRIPAEYFEVDKHGNPYPGIDCVFVPRARAPANSVSKRTNEDIDKEKFPELPPVKRHAGTAPLFNPA
ncbi:MAG: hypothetical protein Q9204_000928 [Flavoplaca sp. TL-2023a]